jgi:hypothetical protein
MVGSLSRLRTAVIQFDTAAAANSSVKCEGKPSAVGVTS